MRSVFEFQKSREKGVNRRRDCPDYSKKALANSTKMCYTYDSLSRVTTRKIRKVGTVKGTVKYFSQIRF